MRRVIDRIRERVRSGKYALTYHALDEMADDEFEEEDFEEAIATGRIVADRKIA